MNANRSGSEKERLIVRLYRTALGCFPEGYRREYADELLYAVRMAAAEAEVQGRLALLRLAWRELRDLPLAALRAHLHERSTQMKLQPGVHLPGGPLNGWKLAAIFFPFLLPLLLTLPDLLPQSTLPSLLLSFGVPLLGVLVVIWILGLVRKFPVWALPALGLILYFFSTYVLWFIVQGTLYFIVMVPLWGGWPEDLGLKIGMALLEGGGSTVILAGVLAGLLRLAPNFRARVRSEWTLLSFLLYGMAIMPLFWYDEFHRVEGYQTASLLILVAGAGLYLAAQRRWQRALALVIPVVLTEAVMSLGFYQTYPLEAWANLADTSARLWESLQPLTDPLPLLLLLSALIPRLPWSGVRELASSPAPNVPVQGSE